MSQRFVSIGEVMVEISPRPRGLYALGFAGDSLNTAWGARALLPRAWSVDYVTAVGDDIYSDKMVSFLTRNGIGTNTIQRISGSKIGLYLIHQDQGDRQFTYWRGQSAAKSMTKDRTQLSAALDGARVIYFSGVSIAILAKEEQDFLLGEITRLRAAGALTVFDPNIRPVLWNSTAEMKAAVMAAAQRADIVLPTFGDEAPIFGDKSPDETATRYLDVGVSEVVVKNGDQPALVMTTQERRLVPALQGIQVVDATGAGDGFNAGYVTGRLDGLSVADSLRRAHRVAARVVRHAGALVTPSLLQEAGREN